MRRFTNSTVKLGSPVRHHRSSHGIRRGRVARLWTVSVLLTSAAACAEPLSPPADEQPRASIGSFAAQASDVRSFEERQALLADALPGYGGHFRRDGVLYVWVKEARSGVEAVRSGIGEFRFAGTTGSGTFANRRRQVHEPVVLMDAEFTFRELYGWYGEMRRGVWRIESTEWTDIDERLNRIEIGLRDIEDTTQVESLLETLSIPSSAVIIVQATGEYTPGVSMTSQVSPRVGGVQIQAGNGTCSFGFATDRTSDSNWYFVSNSHCTSNYSQLDGDDVVQPSGAYQIGYEVSDPSGVTHASDTTCPSGVTCRYADVALFRFTTWDFLHGYVAWPSLGSTDFSTAVAMDISTDTEVGDSVNLVGRTTGRSAGEVVDTCVAENGQRRMD